MAESLKIIHICDHIIKEEFEELKISSIDRQEVREPETINCEDSRLIYKGSWSLVNASLNDSVFRTNSPGDSVTIYFYGNNICLYSRKIPDGGKVKIIIDGEEYGVIDLYNESLIKSEPIIDVKDLIYGMHTVQAQLLSDNNNLSTGHEFMIESAVIEDAIVTELSPYDIISSGDVVKSITCVSQVSDGIKYFKEGTDFIQVGSNKIKWIGINRPNPKYKYDVEYLRRFFKTNVHKTSTCPRCYGLGWYGSFNDLSTGLPSKTQGIYKIAEDIIKIILTPLREDGYGSEFLDMNKNLYVEEAYVKDAALSEINRIEKYYKSVQAEDMANGASYSPEDILYAIIINNASFNAGASTLNIELTVYNNAGQNYEANINI